MDNSGQNEEQKQEEEDKMNEVQEEEEMEYVTLGENYAEMSRNADNVVEMSGQLSAEDDTEEVKQYACNPFQAAAVNVEEESAAQVL